MDKINHEYYKNCPSGVECIDMTMHYCFAIDNAIEDLWEFGLKQELEDLDKAMRYIQNRIKQLENEKETKENN